MHLPTKFHHPMFNRSEVILLTKQTNPQTNKQRFCWKLSPCYTMLCWWKKNNKFRVWMYGTWILL